ncbi:MAG TPA: hypothetical protein VGQ42_08270 [Candidatus Dormibacteraeota bacterium]|nr:hypothetical protein [Candidatus Dormibacteraeota bacterium]
MQPDVLESPEEPVLDAAAEDDFAATALPYVESDGPLPLPPPDRDEAAEEPEVPPTQELVATTPTVRPGERRRVGRIDPTAGTPRAAQRIKSGRQPSTASMFEPLPPEDAAIPFDRVPYVPGDLRRVLIIAGLMVILVIVADIVISNVVK